MKRVKKPRNNLGFSYMFYKMTEPNSKNRIRFRLVHRKSYCAQGAGLSQGDKFELLSRAKCGFLCTRSTQTRAYAFAHLAPKKHYQYFFNGQLVLTLAISLFRRAFALLTVPTEPRRVRTSQGTKKKAYRVCDKLFSGAP